MRLFTTHHPRRAVFAALTASVLLGGSLAVNTTHAAVACRSDPIITLSNGHTVQISDQINDAVTNVTRVDYQLHVPAGVTATNVTYPADNTPGLRETFEFYSDARQARTSLTTPCTTQTAR